MEINLLNTVQEDKFFEYIKCEINIVIEVHLKIPDFWTEFMKNRSSGEQISIDSFVQDKVFED
jgi:hypothetical protein